MSDRAVRAGGSSGPASYVLHGDAEARSAAMDLFHLCCDVQGVCEGIASTEVAISGSLGGLASQIEALGVRIEPAATPAAPWTGLEDDVAVLVCEDLVVRPPWVARPPGFDGVELVVPRGGAFGSGEHGSTRAALALLHAVWPAAAEAVPSAVVDVGTGSGILALYAAQRGASAVGACDIDAPSVRAAHELLLSRRSVVALGGAELFAPGCADLVIANLNGRELLASLDVILGLRRSAPQSPLARVEAARCVLSGMKAGDEEAAIRRRLEGEVLGLRREVDGYVGLVIGG